ncbi:nuclear transport factor 2 family protein [Kitasatospora sp. NPDC050463]|uniref:nuclear transport factor 2 family protein n=1 Tax=Kitasatospora sp. NPDC050463 TaxID=3155786 RepID=UPI0033D65CC1
MLAERLRQAINAHDLDAFMSCFAPDYQSMQPAHPARTFSGRAQVGKNWSAFFREVPDIQAELLGTAVTEGTEWAEWHWHGTRLDGSILDMRGVTVMGVHAGSAAWGRLYMEETEQTDEDIDETVRRLAGGPADQRRA